MIGFTTLGDLSTSLILRRQMTDLRLQAQDLSVQVASGRTHDPAAHLGGDLRAVVALERQMRLAETERLALREAQVAAGARQVALATVQDLAQRMGADLMSVGGQQGTGSIARASADAAAAFDGAVAALNTQAAGRALFSGAAVDRPPLIDGPAMMPALQAVVAGETTAEGMATAVNAWFHDPGGGFEALAWRGAAVPDGALPTAGVTAADAGLRRTLAGLALGALSAGSALGDTERKALLSRAGEETMAGAGAVVAIRAELGIGEGRLEAQATERAAAVSAAETALADLLRADPYEAATRLQAVQGQLQNLYALTARVSRLSLAEYLR